MWDHRSTRKPPPPHLASSSDAHRDKPDPHSRDEVDANSCAIGSKRHAELPETEGVGNDKRHRVDAEQGRAAHVAGINGIGVREAADHETGNARVGPQLDVPEREYMEDRYVSEESGDSVDVRDRTAI